MSALDSSGHKEITKPHGPNEKIRNDRYEHAKEQYGLTVSFIDDNSVHVKDIVGKIVAFEFPLEHISFDEYDTFLQQMQKSKEHLPSIDNIRMSISKPLIDVSFGSRGNSSTYPRTWEQHAQDHHISVEELKSMYLFAAETLYERFKARLRE